MLSSQTRNLRSYSCRRVHASDAAILTVKNDCIRLAPVARQTRSEEAGQVSYLHVVLVSLLQAADPARKGLPRIFLQVYLNSMRPASITRAACLHPLATSISWRPQNVQAPAVQPSMQPTFADLTALTWCSGAWSSRQSTQLAVAAASRAATRIPFSKTPMAGPAPVWPVCYADENCFPVCNDRSLDTMPPVLCEQACKCSAAWVYCFLIISRCRNCHAGFARQSSKAFKTD